MVSAVGSVRLPGSRTYQIVLGQVDVALYQQLALFLQGAVVGCTNNNKKLKSKIIVK
jgi:hypothetical protein